MSDQQFVLMSNSVADTADAPRGADIYYHCTRCDSFIPSQPGDNVLCRCGNIVIDIEYIRLIVRDFSHFEVVREVKKPRPA